MDIYALHDYDDNLKKQGAFQICFSKAQEINKKGYGIFWTPNSFNVSRKKENLEKINYWLADIDDGSKDYQLRNINKLSFKPTVVVETKKGYHCYWKAKDATAENYTTIEIGIINKLGADKGCKDVTRILRFPDFLHQKDKDDPFMVQVVEANEEEYLEKEMLYYFKVPKNEVKYEYKNDGKTSFSDPNNWERLFKLSNIREGNRNNELCKITLWLKDEGLNSNEIENIIKAINAKIEPLPEKELDALLRSKL